MTTSVHPKSTVATRTITTRRPQFDYGRRLARRHFAQGDLLTSHVVSVLSALIPEGEKFVVDAVKRYRGDIDDPKLRQQANAFVGQESVHQREHDRLNKVLQRMGYPTAIIDRWGALAFGVARRMPRPTQLALTAAIEHWTAIIAEHALAEDRTGLADADEEVAAFLTWHLIEEIEHKSVAFDIMQALGTTEEERIASMQLLATLLGPVLVASLLLSLATDPAAWNPVRVLRSLDWMRNHATVAQKSFRSDARSWGRVGFHPDERDHTDLLERWKAEAFGPGSIVEKRSRRAA